MSDERPTAPARREEIHLPGPSIQPFLLTLGIVLVLVGVVEMLPVAVFGLILTVWMVVAWIRDARREMAELPAEH